VPDERVIQQVGGILSMGDVKFTTDESKQSFLVPGESTGVVISFVDLAGSTVVSLHSILLEQVDSSGERKQKILEALNARNESSYFGTFYLDAERGRILVDHHLLGDQLQASELVRALASLLSTADEADDQLRDEVGSGVRAIDAWNAARAQASDPEGAGPVVEA
jgi:hypothetical protein